MLRQYLCAASLLMIAQFCQAQSSGSGGEEPVAGDMSHFLDNGKIGNVKNLIYLRMNRTLAGYFGLSYERKFGRHFGFEAGAYYKPVSGFIFNDVARQAFANTDGKFDPGKTYGGICYMAYPKLYVTGGKSLNNGYFFGLRNFYSTYEADIHNMSLDEPHKVPAKSMSTFLMAGSHQNFRSRYAFGLEMGFGYFKDSYENVTWGQYEMVGGNQKAVYYTEDMSFSGFNLTFDVIFGILF